MANPAVTSAAAAAPSRERLPLSVRLAFGAGDLPAAIATIILSFFQFFFLTTVAGLNPLAAGSIRTLLTVWDAVNDPVIGYLSDRTRSRLGRRRPWILYGAVPFAIFFFLQWIVPPFGETGKFIYYVVVGILFNAAFTAVNTPYTALTPELTEDYDERTTLNAFRFTFSIGGSLVVGVLHQIIVGRAASPQTGYMVSAAIWSFACVPPLIWCVLGTRERHRAADDEPQMGIVEQFRVAFRNRPYLFVIGIYLFSWLAVQITSSILAFYVTFWMGSVPQFPLTLLGLTFSRPEDLIPLMLLAVQGSALVFLFVWNAVSSRIGKKAVYLIGMVFWIGVQAALFFLRPDQVGLAVFLAALAGVGVATAYIVPWSMMPDVIEYDELRTGQRREGIFYGTMVLLQKFGLALGLFLVGVALQTAGFDETLPAGSQPQAALTAIRWMIGPVPTITLILGMILAAYYPITKQKHAEMLAELEARRGLRAEG